jgi:hypothetical protein
VRQANTGTLTALVILLTLGSTAPRSEAQLGLQSQQPSGVSDQFLQRQREIEIRNQNRVEAELPPAQRFRVDYGGWFDSYIFLFDDGINSSRTLRQNDLRVWASISADRGIHEGYLRVRTSYFDWNHGDSFTRNEDDLDGPNLERGWYQFDLARALRVYEQADLPLELKLKIGRDFVQPGTGYAMALPLDHFQVQTDFLAFETTFIGGRTPASTENIDRSRPVADHSDRNFWIIQERFTGFDKHTPFFYIAWQDDNTSEDPPDYLQNYRYDSRYIGFGSTGELIENLRYSTEWVIERGYSYGNERFLHKDNIKAWGFDNLLEYYFKHETKPTVAVEYMYGSGDNDRLGSPTNAEGGNRNDYVDKSFVGFGFRDTGISFAPRLANVHVWRLGGSFIPLAKVEAARNLELGTDYYLYAKDQSDAAVSDSLADRAAGYLGWEMDYYMNYRVTSDLSFTVRYGVFFPGTAFSDQSNRTFLLTGLSWSF